MNTHTEGERLKLQACDWHESSKHAFMRTLKRAIVQAALERDSMTADDVRERVKIPSNINPTAVGAAFVALANAHIIRRIGYRPTGRAIAHARPQAVWSIGNRSAANAWLANHPDIEQSRSQQQTLF